MDEKMKEFLKDCDYRMKKDELIKEIIFFQDYGEEEKKQEEKEEKESC